MSTSPGHLLQWMKLLGLSAGLSGVLFWLHLPAALLLGPMIAGITLSLRGASIRVPRPFFIAAQAIIGCMIARTLTPLFLASSSGTGRWCCLSSSPRLPSAR
jgi:uncharacterized membrane protein AbrB (regulator of aidB expression)